MLNEIWTLEWLVVPNFLFPLSHISLAWFLTSALSHDKITDPGRFVVVKVRCEPVTMNAFVCLFCGRWWEHFCEVFVWSRFGVTICCFGNVCCCVWICGCSRFCWCCYCYFNNWLNWLVVSVTVNYLVSVAVVVGFAVVSFVRCCFVHGVSRRVSLLSTSLLWAKRKPISDCHCHISSTSTFSFPPYYLCFGQLGILYNMEFYPVFPFLLHW